MTGAPGSYTDIITATANNVTASDDATVELTDELPAVTLDKSVDDNEKPEPGGVFTYTLTITNDSIEDVTIATLDDTQALDAADFSACAALVGTTLAAGTSTSCSYAVNHTDAGTYPNTASVTVEDDEGNPASDEDAETVIVTDELPAVTLNKSADPLTLPEPGGAFVFTLTITNDSAEEVTITALTDSNILSQECQDLIGTTIPAGGTADCTYTVTHTEAGSYSNTASVTVADDEGNAAQDEDDETVTVTDELPSVTLDKTADPLTLPEPDGAFTFTVTVTNNSAVEAVTLDSLTDDVYGDLNGQGDCAIGGTIAAGGTYTCSFTGSFMGDAGDSQTDTVTAIVSDNENNQATDSDDATVELTDVLPTVTLEKDVDSNEQPEPGGAFTYTLTITNTSTESVEITALTDTNTLSQECQDLVGTFLDLGEIVSCTYTVTHTDAGSYLNTAEVTVEDNEGNEASNEDSETVIITDVEPTVDLDKSADPLTLPEPGGVFTFTLTITNTSVENVTITGLGDSNVLSPQNTPECLALVGTTLTPGQSVSCEYDITHTDAGTYENTASVTVADNEDNSAEDSDSETVTVTDALPTVDLVKDVTPATLAEPGGVFTYTLTITNNSVEDVTITDLTDTQSGATDFSACAALVGTSLAAGASTSCTYTVTQTDAGSYPNTADVTVADDEGNEASDSDEETVTVTDEVPVVTLDKSADPLTLPEPGGEFTFTLTITNDSVENVTITVLTDDNTLSQECLDLVGDTLTPGQIVSCTYTVTHTDAGSYHNTAVVTVQDDENNPASGQDSETVTVTDVEPDISVTKTASPSSVPETGGDVTFTFVVTNNSVEDVTLTSLTDDVFGDLNGQGDCITGGTIPVGGSYTCSITVFLSSDDLTPHTNTVTAIVTDNEGSTDTATDDETVTFEDLLPSIAVDKIASPTSVNEPGGNVTFTFNVTNNSAEAVTIASLSDTDFTLAGDADCQVGTVLLVGGSCQFGQTELISGDASDPDHENTFTATATDNDDNTATDDDNATVGFEDVLPVVSLTKEVAAPATLPEPGGAFTFTLAITNDSVEAVTITALTDTQSGATDYSACEALVGTSLLPGASTSCSYTVTHTDTGSYENTAEVTVEDNDGNSAKDNDSETVTVTDTQPTVTLDKSATPLTLPEPGGTFTFTLTITNTSVENVTITDLTDTNTLSQECEDLIGTTLTPGQIATCSYTTTQTDAGSYPNTASVAVADDENNTATEEDSETVTVTDVLPLVTLDKSVDDNEKPEPGGTFTYTLTITNDSVEAVTITALTDDNTLSPECEDLVGTTLAAGASTSCTYTVTYTDAGTYPNTASVAVMDDEDNPASDTDSETVTVTDVLPTIDLAKNVTPATRAEPGGVFTYTLILTNNSVETVEITILTDTNTLSAGCQALVGTSLAAGASTSCTYTVTHTEAGTYPNTASVTVEDDEDNPASDTDSETVTVTDVLPTVDLTKTANPTSLTVGQSSTFTLTIKNTSIENVIITALTDTNPLSVACTDLIGDVLTPGQSVTCTYTVTYNAPGSLTNTASVTVQDNETNTATDTATATVTVNKAVPTLVTTPQPSSGKLGVVLNDKGVLSGGYNPTGTIIFRLYDPTQSTCTGTPKFTQTVTVNGNGTYTTTGGFPANRVGTWRWTATYSGDANNNTAISGCNAELVQISYHPGTIGFWMNWRNHYTSSQFQLLINHLKTNNPKIYNKDLVNNTADDLSVAKVDAIYNLGSATPREQMILAQFTALKFNLAITQLQGTGGLVQKNDNLCLPGKIDVSSISGATAFFGTSTPTIQQVVNAVESKWTGKLTTTRSDWKWNLTNAQKDMLIKVITGINEGTLVTSSGCP